MKFPSPEFDDAVAAACHGTADAGLLDALGRILAENGEALDAYLRQTALHAALLTTTDFSVPVDPLEPATESVARSDGSDGDVKPLQRPSAGRQASTWRKWTGRGAAAVMAVMAAIAGLWLPGWAKHVAQLPARQLDDRGADVIGLVAAVDSVVWMTADTDLQSGDCVRIGQKVEIAEGTLRIDCNNGARLQLSGPAVFEIESPLSAVLSMGRVRVTADTPESKGFTVRTRSGRIVDLGTEFVAEALPDGRCRIGVTSGEVKFHLANSADGQLLRAGDLLEVEPGSRQVVTRIERGDESPAFVFPTIEPPSAEDFADAAQGRAIIRRVRGQLYENLRKRVASAPPEILLDGKGQSEADSPSESLYFTDGDTGAVVIDLGVAVSLSKVNVFSWHLCRNPGFPQDLREAHRERAAQNYVLYGFVGDEAPDVGDDPAAAGWTLIARVKSDEYFGLTGISRPAQQASSIASARGSIGRFRHLLFVVQPTKGTNHDGSKLDFGTFFGEIDVYAN